MTVKQLKDALEKADCREHAKARKLGIDKIQSAYARHDGDLWEVTKYIRRASV